MQHAMRGFALTAGTWAALQLCAAAQVGGGITRTVPPEYGYTPSEIWFRSITVNGFAEGSYSYNFNQPDSGTNTLRVFDFDDRTFKLDVFELVAQRAIAKPGEIGFRFDAVYGQSIPKVSAAAGLFRSVSTGKAEDYDLQQGYVSWIAPLGQGLRIDLGKFVTPFGYEVIEGYDGYNDNQTRSFLFGSAIPFTHTGVRASYPFAKEITATVMAVQGWDNWHDNNDAKSFGAQLALTPTPAWSVNLTAMGGPEQKDDTNDNRMLYGLTNTLKASDVVTVGLDTVYGQEDHAALTGGSATWSGAAAYFHWDFTKTASIALRAEMLDDTDGARTGTAQKLKSVTFTPSCKLSENMILRCDLREDWSDENVFEDQSGAASNGDQFTAIVGLLIVI